MYQRYSTKTILMVVLIIISTVAIDTAWKINLENSARTQAKYNLNQVALCVNNLLLMDEDGLLTRYGIKQDEEIEKALYTCAKNMRVSPNGDIWAYDLFSKKYVFDSNARYGDIKDRRFTKNEVCGKKEWCRRLLTIMNSGYDSAWMGYSWIFKHDKEYLEWKVLPSETLGFDGVSRTGSTRPQQIVVVQGARERELLERYKWFRLFIYGLGFIMIVLNLMINVHIRYGRRKDDA